MRFIFFMVCSLALQSCFLFDTDEVPTEPASLLPEITSEGANVIGFLIDERVAIINDDNPENVTLINFIDSDGGLASRTLDITLGEGTGLFDPDNSVTLRVEIDNFDGPREYDIINESINILLQFDDCTLSSESIIDGTITIQSFSENQDIVSGVFEFTASNELCGNLVISNGRFDFFFQSINF